MAFRPRFILKMFIYCIVFSISPPPKSPSNNESNTPRVDGSKQWSHGHVCVCVCVCVCIYVYVLLGPVHLRSAASTGVWKVMCHHQHCGWVITTFIACRNFGVNKSKTKVRRECVVLCARTCIVSRCTGRGRYTTRCRTPCSSWKERERKRKVQKDSVYILLVERKWVACSHCPSVHSHARRGSRGAAAQAYVPYRPV